MDRDVLAFILSSCKSLVSPDSGKINLHVLVKYLVVETWCFRNIWKDELVNKATIAGRLTNGPASRDVQALVSHSSSQSSSVFFLYCAGAFCWWDRT